MATRIRNTPIAVDCWQPSVYQNARIFFLTHMHGDHTVGLSSNWCKPLFCSAITKKLAMHKFKIAARYFHVIEPNESITVHLDLQFKETMTVTAIDANHIPGALMYLFEGYFGTILHTGDFRMSNKMFKPNSPLSTKTIDVLYLDNTYLNGQRSFPSREDAVKMCKAKIRQQTGTRIYIALRNAGKEQLLVRLAEIFNTKIVTQQERLSMYKLMDLPDVFTLDKKLGFIETKDVCRHVAAEPRYTIIPTAMYCAEGRNSCTIPYSDHSNQEELFEFVQRIRPKQVEFIVQKQPPDSSSRFKNLLSKEPLRTFKVPLSVETFMYSSPNVATAVHNLPRTIAAAAACRKPVIGRIPKKPKGVQYSNSPEKGKQSSDVSAVIASVLGKETGNSSRSQATSKTVVNSTAQAPAASEPHRASQQSNIDAPMRSTTPVIEIKPVDSSGEESDIEVLSYEPGRKGKSLQSEQGVANPAEIDNVEQEPTASNQDMPDATSFHSENSSVMDFSDSIIPTPLFIVSDFSSICSTDTPPLEIFPSQSALPGGNSPTRISPDEGTIAGAIINIVPSSDQDSMPSRNAADNNAILGGDVIEPQQIQNKAASNATNAVALADDVIQPHQNKDSRQPRVTQKENSGQRPTDPRLANKQRQQNVENLQLLDKRLCDAAKNAEKNKQTTGSGSSVAYAMAQPCNSSQENCSQSQFVHEANQGNDSAVNSSKKHKKKKKSKKKKSGKSKSPKRSSPSPRRRPIIANSSPIPGGRPLIAQSKAKVLVLNPVQVDKDTHKKQSKDSTKEKAAGSKSTSLGSEKHKYKEHTKTLQDILSAGNKPVERSSSSSKSNSRTSVPKSTSKDSDSARKSESNANGSSSKPKTKEGTHSSTDKRKVGKNVSDHTSAATRTKDKHKERKDSSVLVSTKDKQKETKYTEKRDSSGRRDYVSATTNDRPKERGDSSGHRDFATTKDTHKDKVDSSGRRCSTTTKDKQKENKDLTGRRDSATTKDKQKEKRDLSSDSHKSSVSVTAKDKHKDKRNKYDAMSNKESNNSKQDTHIAKTGDGAVKKYSSKEKQKKPPYKPETKLSEDVAESMRNLTKMALQAIKEARLQEQAASVDKNLTSTVQSSEKNVSSFVTSQEFAQERPSVVTQAAKASSCREKTNDDTLSIKSPQSRRRHKEIVSCIERLKQKFASEKGSSSNTGCWQKSTANTDALQGTRKEKYCAADETQVSIVSSTGLEGDKYGTESRMEPTHISQSHALTPNPNALHNFVMLESQSQNMPNLVDSSGNSELRESLPPLSSQLSQFRFKPTPDFQSQTGDKQQSSGSITPSKGSETSSLSKLVAGIEESYDLDSQQDVDELQKFVLANSSQESGSQTPQGSTNQEMSQNLQTVVQTQANLDISLRNIIMNSQVFAETREPVKEVPTETTGGKKYGNSKAKVLKSQWQRLPSMVPTLGEEYPSDESSVLESMVQPSQLNENCNVKHDHNYFCSQRAQTDCRKNYSKTNVSSIPNQQNLNKETCPEFPKVIVCNLPQSLQRKLSRNPFTILATDERLRCTKLRCANLESGEAEKSPGILQDISNTPPRPCPGPVSVGKSADLENTQHKAKASSKEQTVNSDVSKKRKDEVMNKIFARVKRKMCEKNIISQVDGSPEESCGNVNSILDASCGSDFVLIDNFLIENSPKQPQRSERGTMSEVHYKVSSSSFPILKFKKAQSEPISLHSKEKEDAYQVVHNKENWGIIENSPAQPQRHELKTISEVRYRVSSSSFPVVKFEKAEREPILSHPNETDDVSEVVHNIDNLDAILGNVEPKQTNPRFYASDESFRSLDLNVTSLPDLYEQTSGQTTPAQEEDSSLNENNEENLASVEKTEAVKEEEEDSSLNGNNEENLASVQTEAVKEDDEKEEEEEDSSQDGHKKENLDSIQAEAANDGNSSQNGYREENLAPDVANKQKVQENTQETNLEGSFTSVPELHEQTREQAEPERNNQENLYANVANKQKVQENTQETNLEESFISLPEYQGENIGHTEPENQIECGKIPEESAKNVLCKSNRQVKLDTKVANKQLLLKHAQETNSDGESFTSLPDLHDDTSDQAEPDNQVKREKITDGESFTSLPDLHDETSDQAEPGNQVKREKITDSVKSVSCSSGKQMKRSVADSIPSCDPTNTSGAVSISISVSAKTGETDSVQSSEANAISECSSQNLRISERRFPKNVQGEVEERYVEPCFQLRRLYTADWVKDPFLRSTYFARYTGQKNDKKSDIDVCADSYPDNIKEENTISDKDKPKDQGLNNKSTNDLSAQNEEKHTENRPGQKRKIVTIDDNAGSRCSEVFSKEKRCKIEVASVAESFITTRSSPSREELGTMAPSKEKPTGIEVYDFVSTDESFMSVVQTPLKTPAREKPTGIGIYDFPCSNDSFVSAVETPLGKTLTPRWLSIHNTPSPYRRLLGTVETLKRASKQAMNSDNILITDNATICAKKRSIKVAFPDLCDADIIEIINRPLKKSRKYVSASAKCVTVINYEKEVDSKPTNHFKGSRRLEDIPEDEQTGSHDVAEETLISEPTKQITESEPRRQNMESESTKLYEKRTETKTMEKSLETLHGESPKCPSVRVGDPSVAEETDSVCSRIIINKNVTLLRNRLKLKKKKTTAPNIRWINIKKEFESKFDFCQGNLRSESSAVSVHGSSDGVKSVKVQCASCSEEQSRSDTTPSNWSEKSASKSVSVNCPEEQNMTDGPKQVSKPKQKHKSVMAVENQVAKPSKHTGNGQAERTGLEIRAEANGVNADKSGEISMVKNSEKLIPNIIKLETAKACVSAGELCKIITKHAICESMCKEKIQHSQAAITDELSRMRKSDPKINVTKCPFSVSFRNAVQEGIDIPTDFIRKCCHVDVIDIHKIMEEVACASKASDQSESGANDLTEQDQNELEGITEQKSAPEVQNIATVRDGGSLNLEADINVNKQANAEITQPEFPKESEDLNVDSVCSVASAMENESFQYCTRDEQISKFYAGSTDLYAGPKYSIQNKFSLSYAGPRDFMSAPQRRAGQFAHLSCTQPFQVAFEESQGFEYPNKYESDVENLSPEIVTRYKNTLEWSIAKEIVSQNRRVHRQKVEGTSLPVSAVLNSLPKAFCSVKKRSDSRTVNSLYCVVKKRE